MGQHLFYRSDATFIKKELQTYFSTGFLCDMKVVCGKSRYNVHKLVLSAASPLLWHLFANDDKIEQIELSEFDELEVHSFIYDLYGMATQKTSTRANILKVLNISQPSSVDFHSSIKEEAIEIVPISYSDDTINNVDNNGCAEYHDNDDDGETLTGHDDLLEVSTKKRGRPILGLRSVEVSKKTRERPKLGSVKKPRPSKMPKPDQRTVQCSICKLACETKTELFQHRESEHQLKHKKNEKGKFSCDHCGNLCGRRRDLLYHIKHSCPACTLPCTHCPRKFPNTRALDSHITRLHDPTHREKALIRKKFVCPICGMELRKHVYEYHVASHDPHADLSMYEKFECEGCGKKYTSFSRFTRHGCKKNGMVFDDNDGNLMCTLCLHQLKDKKEAIAHKKEKHADKFQIPYYGNFECPYPDCDLERRKISDIKIHLQMVHYRVKRSICDICFERFETSHLKTKHVIEVHKISSEFQCETCGQECRSLYGLKDHNYMVHSDERRFKCKYCQKAFKRNSELKRHLFIHESHLSQNVCDVCGKAFRDVSSLKAHVATHI